MADAAGLDHSDALFRRNVVEIPDATCVRAGLRVATLLERVLGRPDEFDDARAQRALRAEVSDALADLLMYRMPAWTSRLTYACRADIVRRVHDYVIALQSVVQTGPLTYVRSLRLAQVRRLLLDNRRTDMPVSAAASRWGFMHLGRFASVYMTF